ncbi:MAG: hypothetical protein NW204_08710 [Xanthomonadaceae bacterium]|nr:hypothetical protein [Xanthomonadaceae bacterium]
MLNDPITRWAIVLDVLAAIMLALGLLALYAPSAVGMGPLADRTLALALVVFGAVGWIVAAGMLVSRLIAARRPKP